MHAVECWDYISWQLVSTSVLWNLSVRQTIFGRGVISDPQLGRSQWQCYHKCQNWMTLIAIPFLVLSVSASSVVRPPFPRKKTVCLVMYGAGLARQRKAGGVLDIRLLFHASLPYGRHAELRAQVHHPYWPSRLWFPGTVDVLIGHCETTVWNLWNCTVTRIVSLSLLSTLQ